MTNHGFNSLRRYQYPEGVCLRPGYFVCLSPFFPFFLFLRFRALLFEPWISGNTERRKKKKREGKSSTGLRGLHKQTSEHMQTGSIICFELTAVVESHFPHNHERISTPIISPPPGCMSSMRSRNKNKEKGTVTLTRRMDRADRRYYPQIFPSHHPFHPSLLSRFTEHGLFLILFFSFSTFFFSPTPHFSSVRGSGLTAMCLDRGNGRLG